MWPTSSLTPPPSADALVLPSLAPEPDGLPHQSKFPESHPVRVCPTNAEAPFRKENITRYTHCGHFETKRKLFSVTASSFLAHHLLKMQLKITLLVLPSPVCEELVLFSSVLGEVQWFDT